MSKLPKDFYLRDDVVKISKELLGKFIFTNIDGFITGGMITETEAYKAPEDKASHAFGNRKTDRTKIIYSEGGVSYVYLCYGIHYLFNVVTNKENTPHAILIRSIEPIVGIDIMMQRRNKSIASPLLTSGPGSLSSALGINKKHNNIDLTGDTIWIEDRSINIQPRNILASPRVGIAYAEEYVLKPWRFRIKNSKWTSKPA